jgi:hypothetical protein
MGLQVRYGRCKPQRSSSSFQPGSYEENVLGRDWLVQASLFPQLCRLEENKAYEDDDEEDDEEDEEHDDEDKVREMESFDSQVC